MLPPGYIVRSEKKTSEELKCMFANPKHGPLHNARTCVQCIPWMPAREVPYQSLQLFWCVVQRPPCPPHRPGMCSLWASRLWIDQPLPAALLLPSCPSHLMSIGVCDLFIAAWKASLFFSVPQKASHHTTKTWRIFVQTARQIKEEGVQRFTNIWSVLICSWSCLDSWCGLSMSQVKCSG